MTTPVRAALRALDRRGSVQPAWLTAGAVELEFLDSILNLYRDQRAAPLLADPISFRSGPHLSVSRTVITRQFLAGTAQWLLMLDADMVFTADDVLRLLEAADPDTAPFVGGCAYGIERGKGRNTEWKPTGEPAVGPLVPVRVIGAGFLLVHRNVFERLLVLHGPPLPWFAEAIVRDGPACAVYSHDWEFARRVREDLQQPIYAHEGVQVGHVKRMTIGGDPDGDLISVGAERRLAAAPPDPTLSQLLQQLLDVPATQP